MIKKYVCLSFVDAQTLSSTVNKHLKDGWELHGLTMVTENQVTASYAPTYYTQAMIQKKESE